MNILGQTKHILIDNSFVFKKKKGMNKTNSKQMVFTKMQKI